MGSQKIMGSDYGSNISDDMQPAWMKEKVWLHGRKKIELTSFYLLRLM
jgi:hypothetical protein